MGVTSPYHRVHIHDLSARWRKRYKDVESMSDGRLRNAGNRYLLSSGQGGDDFHKKSHIDLY